MLMRRFRFIVCSKCSQSVWLLGISEAKILQPEIDSNYDTSILDGVQLSSGDQ